MLSIVLTNIEVQCECVCSCGWRGLHALGLQRPKHMLISVSFLKSGNGHMD